MRRSGFILACLLLMSTSYLTLVMLPISVTAATHFVGGIGPGNYTSIQAAIDAASPGDTVYVYNGTYYENLVIGKTISLVGENKDITTIEGDGDWDVVLVYADWVNISGFTVVTSPFAWPDYYAGIRLHSVQNCNITNNILSSNYIGVYSTASRNVMIASNNFSNNSIGVGMGQVYVGTFVDNTFFRNGQGIYLGASSYVTMLNNTMTEDGIYLQGNSIEYWNTHIIDTTNTVNGRPVRYWKNATGGTVSLDAGLIILANCTNVIAENQNIDKTLVGILLSFIRDSVIANNSLSEIEFGIDVQYSTNVTIEGNDIWNHGWGINPWYSSDIIIRNNTLSTDRPISHEWGGGIHPFRSDHVTIVDNDISHSGEAIYLQNSEYVTVLNNDLLSNGGEGVRSWVCNNVTVFDNNISNNGLGIRLFYSDDFLIYHNNLTNNTIQAIDWQSNKWDNGYLSGGNYWSNYTGVDNCSGPNQDVCPDPDGIGDTPFVIDGDSQDTYPLMSPPGIILPRPPQELQAAVSGPDPEDINVTWSFPRDEGPGKDSVVCYVAHRHASYDHTDRAGAYPILIQVQTLQKPTEGMEAQFQSRP